MQKHRQVSQELRTEIATGKYGDAGRLPSEAQLVERFGVSRPTIGRALQDLQNEGLVERRAGSGSFVRPQAKSNETHILGLLVPGRGSTEVLDLICGEIGAMARLRNYGLLWGRSAHPLQDRTLDAQLAEEACQQFIKENETQHYCYQGLCPPSGGSHNRSSVVVAIDELDSSAPGRVTRRIAMQPNVDHVPPRAERHHRVKSDWTSSGVGSRRLASSSC